MKSFENINDEELVLDAREGNADAEEALILRYMPHIRSFVRPYFLAGGDFEDLIQEGMIGVVKAISGFDGTRHASFKTFAALCVKNRVYSVIRNSQRGKNSPLNNYISFETAISETAVVADPVEDVISRENYVELLNEVTERLSSLEIKVLDLYLEGLSYSEISEKLSKPQKSVDNAVQRIRKKLLQYHS